MNKRIFIWLIVIIIVIVAGCWVTLHKGDKTIEGAIEKTGRRGARIIHQEKVQDGIVVFAKRITGDDYVIEAGYIKKSLLGWKWITGGGFSGYSGQYFKPIPKTPFPMLIGDIDNKQIAKVQIKDIEHNNIRDVKIIGNSNDRIWFAFLGKSEGPIFKIIYLDDKGKIIDSKEINTQNSTNF